MKVTIHVTAYELETIYQEKEDEILSFAKDLDYDRILLLTRSGAKRSENNIEKRQFHIKVLDEKTGKIELNLKVSNKKLCGLMICGHCRLLDGHIYYGNKIIKVRYDLLESMKPH